MTLIRPAGDFDRDYQHDMAYLRKPWHWVAIIALLVAMATSPLWASAYVVITLNQVGYTLIAVQGLNILTGYTGQISLGHAAFMLVGGYISALIVIHMGLSVFIAIPLAAILTGVFSIIFGLPSLRVKGFYLTMATLAAQFIIPWMSRHTFKEYLGGSTGAITVPPPILGQTVIDQPSEFIYITLIAVIVSSVLIHNISRTRLGRAFISVRDNDLAAELLGVNLYAYKLRAFFLSGAFAGLAGALKAHAQRGVGTEYGYGLDESIILLGMLVIGGLGSNIGPYLGTGFVILVEDLAEIVGAALASAFPDQSINLLTSFRPLFFGLLLMTFLIFEPRGIAYRWRIILTSWRLRPFSQQ